MLDWEHIFATRSSRMQASEIRELLKLLDRPDIISFAGGIPDPALFPDEEFKAGLCGHLLRRRRSTPRCNIRSAKATSRCANGSSAEMAKIGIACTADNVFITSGSQQGARLSRQAVPVAERHGAGHLADLSRRAAGLQCL